MEFENLIKLIDTVSASNLTGFKYEAAGVNLSMKKGGEKSLLRDKSF